MDASCRPSILNRFELCEFSLRGFDRSFNSVAAVFSCFPASIRLAIPPVTMRTAFTWRSNWLVADRCLTAEDLRI